MPADFVLHSVSFWVQAHGMQIREMNKEVGVEIGTTLGQVLEVRSDPKGGVVGRCIRIRTLVDIHKPIVRWTIGGSLCCILFRSLWISASIVDALITLIKTVK